MPMGEDMLDIDPSAGGLLVCTLHIDVLGLLFKLLGLIFEFTF